MNFSEWYDELPCDEQAALCEHDVWAGAVNTAIKKLEEEHKTLLLHKLEIHATGANGCIEILKRMLED
jgi:hypothetical protein